jgi:hypothetical protein
MSVPAVPSTTCEVTWIENGVIVTDGLPATVVGYFHPQDVDNMVPMTSMCTAHYSQINPRELYAGIWTFTTVAPIVPTSRIPDPNTQAPPRLEPQPAQPLASTRKAERKTFGEWMALAFSSTVVGVLWIVGQPLRLIDHFTHKEAVSYPCDKSDQEGRM